MGFRATYCFIFCAFFSQIGILSASHNEEKKQFVSNLLSQMTLEEKVGQMTQLNINLVSKGSSIYQLDEPQEIDKEKLKEAILKYHAGSFINCPGYAISQSQWLLIIKEIQEVATKESRLKIPIIYGVDAVHGANYLSNGVLFPHPIAQAATWDSSWARKVAEITAYETRSTGVSWNFSPTLDVMRQPLWVRSYETFGEDVFLAKAMGLAAVKGYEGNNLSSPTNIASCLKHFIGYSWPYSGKDRTTANLGEGIIREYLLPPFEEAIKAGAKSVMVNSADINGIPGLVNKKWLVDVLRNELGFEGIIVTDWADIYKLNEVHKTSPTLKHAVKSSIDAGVDMSMVPNDYKFSQLLIELVNEGEITEERIDKSVTRILNLKYDLGLFENPVTPNFEYSKVSSPEFEKVSYQVAAEGITLLKNQNKVLPLSTNQNILVTGPMANSLSMVNGSWSRTWQGNDESKNLPEKLNILQAILKNSNKASYAKGCGFENLNLDINWEIEVSKADVIIACMGEYPATEKPGDINDLTLSESQLQYIEELNKFKKPIILVLVEGRPRIISRIDGLCSAVIQAYYPSEEGTMALSDILFGKVNPSGKLPYTYPRHTNNLASYDYKESENIGTNFQSGAFNPQYEFGFGLSYTTFSYSNFKLIEELVVGKEVLKFFVDVTNTGNVPGKEVVQLYISDLFASIAPPNKRLRAFEKLSLESGETKTVELVIEAKDLAFVGIENNRVLEPGSFTAKIADQIINFEIN